jgi:hypothetical protein
VCAFVDNHGTTGVLEVPRPSPLLNSRAATLQPAIDAPQRF